MKLISNDIKKLVQSAINNGSEPVKYELELFTNIAIGDVYITKIKGERPVMNLTERYTKDYGKLWINDVGKILMKELRRDENNLYELKTDTFNALLKLISKDELPEFDEKGMTHVAIGDNKYTIIKVVPSKMYYCNKLDDYDIDFDVDEDLNSEIIDINGDEYDDDDYISPKRSNSKALF